MRPEQKKAAMYLAGAFGVLWLVGGFAVPKRTFLDIRGIERGLDKLAPSFRVKVEKLLRLMQDMGFRPLVWETYRDPARAQRLATERLKGASMHTLGLAVDIVDAEKKWEASPEFWEALGSTAESLGLTWGGRFPTVDNPHIQGISLGRQDAMRATTTLAQREALLKRIYKG